MASNNQMTTATGTGNVISTGCLDKVDGRMNPTKISPQATLLVLKL